LYEKEQLFVESIMHLLKIAIGILALLFIGWHLLEFPSFLEKVSSAPSEMKTSLWMGKIVAVAIGFAVATTMFRKKMPSGDGL
jgi:hypothetical protein